MDRGEERLGARHGARGPRRNGPAAKTTGPQEEGEEEEEGGEAEEKGVGLISKVTWFRVPFFLLGPCTWCTV